jgi:ubiquitin
MSLHAKISTLRQPDKFTIDATKERNEALIAALLEHESVEFMLRSFYEEGNEDTNITKRILDAINLKTCPRESELLESLLSAASQIPHDIKIIDDKKTFQFLVQLQKLKIKQHLDPKRKTVSVYFPDTAYREQVGDILNKLRAINYNAITFVGALCNDKHEKGGDVYYGGHGIIKQMDFVDLFICATYAHDLPKNAKKIYFMHDIHDSPVSKEEDILKMITEYDYHFAPSSSVLERVKKQIYQARTKGYLKEEKEIGLIPGGYIKLDQNLKLFEQYKKREKILIHAPTVMDADIEEYACLPQHSERIVGALLDNFPDYKIIFRPHPHTAKTAPALRIVEKYKGNSRFIFDDNASFYMSNYAKSALMITDFSGTAFTYAFTTLRPVLFFSHNENAFQNKFFDFKFVKDRNKIGVVAQNIDELTKSIRSLLKEKNSFESRIKEYRDSLIYNLGHSEEYFAENIDYIISDQKHSDWTYLKVDPLPPQLLEEGYKGFNIINFKNKYIALSQELGNINMEKVITSEANLDFKCFVGSSKAEARGYVDGINHSIKLIEDSRGEKLKVKRLEKTISRNEIREKVLMTELEDKVDLLEQLMIEVDRTDDKTKFLTREIESNNQRMEILKRELTDKNLKIEALTNEIADRGNQLESLIEKMNGKISKTEALSTDRKGQPDIWMGGASGKQSEAKALMSQANSKTDTLIKELELRDKWIQLLRVKLKATANQRKDFDKELKKVKSSFLYRLIK